MQSQLLYFDDERAAALRLAEACGLPAAQIERHRFPDDELRLRLPLAKGDVIAEQLVFYRGLDHPNEKLVELLLVAGEARRLGACTASPPCRKRCRWPMRSPSARPRHWRD